MLVWEVGVVLSKSGFCGDLGKFLSLGLGLNKQGNEGSLCWRVLSGPACGFAILP